MPEFTIPNPSGSIVDSSGRMNQVFRTWVNNVNRESTIVGDGSPEGVIKASLYREYIDKNASTGSIKYIKMLSDIGGDVTQGWFLL